MFSSCLCILLGQNSNCHVPVSNVKKAKSHNGVFLTEKINEKIEIINLVLMWGHLPLLIMELRFYFFLIDILSFD